MKYLLSILCLFIFSCDEGTSEVGGCTDANACNFSSNATADDGSCEFPENNYDCDENCIVETDEGCNCGVRDDCYECGGDNFNDLGYNCTDMQILWEIIDSNSSLQPYTPMSLPRSLWENGRLIGLDLHGMSIESIPESIGTLTMLKHLLLYENNLTDIPDNIKNLNNLEELMLGFNLFTEFPSSLYEITSLTGIWIEDNEINSSLSADIGNLVNLRHLNIQNNAFHSTIPEAICNLDLPYSNLDITYIWSSEISYGGNNETWRYFDIRNNAFCATSLPTCLTEENLGSQDCTTP